jgi:hypothetical protein
MLFLSGSKYYRRDFNGDLPVNRIRGMVQIKIATNSFIDS